MHQKYNIFLLLFAILFSNVICADEYHYNNMLIGNRASGLAGAYVSIADDPSGLYYNPAGTVYSASTNISANMNAFQFTRTTYKDALGAGKDWVRTSSGLIPNFFGITQPLGPGTVGFSYAVTDYALEDQDQIFIDVPGAGNEYTINFNNQDTTNNIGPSYAVAIGNDFSIGLTLYGHMRNQQFVLNQLVNFNKTSSTIGSDIFEWENQYSTTIEYGIRPVLGFMFTPVEKISLGLSLSQTYLLYSKTTVQSTKATLICPNGTTLELCPNEQTQLTGPTTVTTNNKRKFPWTVNVGATYFASSRLMLTASGWIYESLYTNMQPIINVAGGLEYYLTNRIAVRLGAYTNMANTPEIKEGVIADYGVQGPSYDEHVDIYGATMSFTHFTRSSAISLGMAGTYGTGKAHKVQSGEGQSAATQDTTVIGMTFFLSATNSF